MSRGRLVLLGSLVVVVVAALVAWPDDGPPAPPADGVGTILRSLGPIERGTLIDAAADGGLIVETATTSDDLPSGALTGLAETRGRVAVFDIPAGTVLSAAMFVTPARLAAGLVDRLSDSGHVAVAVTVDATRAVGGWLRPGDLVNILVASTCPDELALRSVASAAGPDADLRCRRTRHLFQAVRVLAVGPSSEPLPGATDPRGVQDVAVDEVAPFTGAATVVLEVPPAASAWIAAAENDLWFTLVPPEYQAAPVSPPPLVWERLPGEDAEVLTPYGPGGLR
jgi:Flp pilus assembly protein CpaB